MAIWILLAVLATDTSFPERSPGMIEACINEAIASDLVSTDDYDHKYICGNEAAQELWDFLEDVNVESFEQTTENGVWLSRSFPLGGCFKRVRNVDGSVANTGLSCTIWIPFRRESQS
jgi:hypothetical protein